MYSIVHVVTGIILSCSGESNSLVRSFIKLWIKMETRKRSMVVLTYVDVVEQNRYDKGRIIGPLMEYNRPPNVILLIKNSKRSASVIVSNVCEHTGHKKHKENGNDTHGACGFSVSVKTANYVIKVRKSDEAERQRRTKMDSRPIKNNKPGN